MTNNYALRARDGINTQGSQDERLLAELGFLPGLQELLMLRQVHALEHGTVWVLTELAETQPNALRAHYGELSGMSTEQGFYLYGQVIESDLLQAIKTAGDRLRSGAWQLAVHPRCGTNLSVTMMLMAGLAGGAAWLFPKDPFSQLLGIGTAAATAMAIAPELGEYAQRYITTAIPFNLVFDNLVATEDWMGRPTHFVQLRWQNSQ